jgi:hypothetical protein
MNTAAVEPIILGHNPFFGVNLLSRAAGNATAAHFEDPTRVVEVLLGCHELGVRGLMLPSHPRAALLCRAIAEQPDLSREWQLYPLIPHTPRHELGPGEKGPVAMMMDTLPQANAWQKVSLLVQGGRGLFRRDVEQGLKQLIDVEMTGFNGRRLGAVFLHDALTDLAVGLGMEATFKVFRDHIGRKYGVSAGFATKNLPLLCARLQRMGWDMPLVMPALNARGFGVNPSLGACEELLRAPSDMTVVARGSLAGGALEPEVAYRYLAQFPAIRSVVVGISSQAHAAATVDAIRRLMPCARDKVLEVGGHDR